MSAFFIFATVVTVAYIIYYTVIVCIDLWGKPKDRERPGAESFELEDAGPEESRVVEETDGGFRVSGSGGREEVHELAALIPENAPAPEEADPAPKLDGTGAPVSEAVRKIESLQEDMDPIDPESSGAIGARELAAAIIGDLTSVDIERTVSRAGNATEVNHGGEQRI